MIPPYALLDHVDVRERVGAAIGAVDLEDGLGASVEAYGALAVGSVLSAYVIAGVAGISLDSGWEIRPTSPELGLVALAGDHDLGLLLRGGIAPGLAPRPPPGLTGAPELVAQARPADRAPATPAVTWARLSAATPLRSGPWAGRIETGLDWPLIVGAELPTESPRPRLAAAAGRDLPAALHVAAEAAVDDDGFEVALTLGGAGGGWAWSLSAGPGAARLGLSRDL